MIKKEGSLIEVVIESAGFAEEYDSSYKTSGIKGGYLKSWVNLSEYMKYMSHNKSGNWDQKFIRLM